MDQYVTQPTTVRHRVGTCPGCQCGLYAEVQIVTQVHSPRLDQDGKPLDCAHALVTGSTVEHSCSRRVDGPWIEVTR